MKYTLTTTTLIAGLVTSLYCVADSDLASCLADNADKKDKMTVCLDQLHKSMADSRKQELQQKYEQTVSDLNKQDAAKRGGSTTSPSNATPDNSNAGASNPASQAPSGTASNTTTPSSSASGATTNESSTSTSSSTTTDQSTAPQKKSVDVRPEPREKPKGVQWY